MNRICLTAMLLAAGSMPVLAQRLDGCPEQENPLASVVTPSGRALDQALRSAGVGLTRDVLTIELRDPRPDVRSLAALKLMDADNKPEVPPLFQAWLMEKDACTKGTIGLALSAVVASLAWDRGQHPGDQPWITPFQNCTAPPSPLVTLIIEQDSLNKDSSPAVRITARNQTPLPIAFVWDRDPQALFSASVTDPSGAPAKPAKGREQMYKPMHDVPGLIGHSPSGVVLLPHEDPTWTWRVGEDFDMSAPGTYHVSLGGKIGYLDTTVCSNTASVMVEKK